MRFRKIVASFLLSTALLSLCACDDESPSPPPQQNDPFVVLQDNVTDLFNAGIEKLSSAKSYTMTGSLSSVAEVLSSGELTTNRTPVELTYQDGKLYVDSMDGTVDPHRTYFDGERYYFELPPDLKYFTLTNDHVDYGATDYLIPVNSEVVMNPQLAENPDGTRTVSFKMPFNIYQSPALDAWLGVVFDDAFAAANINIEVNIDAEGYITNFLVSYVNDTALGDDPIRQEIAVKMTLTNYNRSEVLAPTDLELYEDWIETVGPEETVPIGELSPEDIG